MSISTDCLAGNDMPIVDAFKNLFPSTRDQAMIRAQITHHANVLTGSILQIVRDKSVDLSLLDLSEPLNFVAWAVYRSAITSRLSDARLSKITTRYIPVEFNTLLYSMIADVDISIQDKHDVHQQITMSSHEKWIDYGRCIEIDGRRMSTGGLMDERLMTLIECFAKYLFKNSETSFHKSFGIRVELFTVADRMVDEVSRAWVSYR